jgi:hypothetical protein
LLAGVAGEGWEFSRAEWGGFVRVHKRFAGVRKRFAEGAEESGGTRRREGECR